MPPFCRHFPRCGGCQTLDFPYAVQLRRKEEHLRFLAQDFPNCEIFPVMPSPRTEGYRHKVQLPFGLHRGEMRPLLGCYAENSHKVVDQNQCEIQDPALSRVAWAVRDWAHLERIPIYDERNGSGFLRHILLRKGLATGEILLGLVANGPRPNHYRKLAASLRKHVERALVGTGATLTGIVQDINMRNTNVVLGGRIEPWWGRVWIKEKLGQHTYHLELSTFFQVNPYQTPRLYQAVEDLIPPGSRVLDAYCGLGTIAMWLSSTASEVVGVEENPASVEAAKRAAAANNVENVHFECGDASVLLPEICAEGFDSIVVDPPRKGMEAPALQALLDSGAKRIVYVSCQPESLMRDAAVLSSHYNLRAIQPVDMFPHTLHVESVALFEQLPPRRYR